MLNSIELKEVNCMPNHLTCFTTVTDSQKFIYSSNKAVVIVIRFFFVDFIHQTTISIFEHTFE